MNARKSLPRFGSVKEESCFWDETSTTAFESEDVTEEFFREAEAHAGAKKRVTLLLDEELIGGLKKLASKHHMPYQSLARGLLRAAVAKAR